MKIEQNAIAAAEPPLDCRVVREALRELVLLKDLHDEIGKLRPGSPLRLDMERTYRERKPSAWAAARVALAHNAGVTSATHNEPNEG